ncbi:hypothetical protein Ctob_013145 [Chrysochromulina tobinii]|uniref:Uncharacterized protein n=1 Tax=Chrysochromulina tobinii TaxID=1460289 RepID=A0A0M0K275_9EUKA|nr:hypothetical protein Ctob_013145 [Chrysochromulina tobinii]|eukprot:KOO32468.1 hypothetical protein Ctob_013145 [Chrysochromulina sp. CCMP291]
MATAASASASSDDTVVQWKSYMGVTLSADKRFIKAIAKGWGRSGALSDAAVTRQGTLEGFTAVLINPRTSLFIGFSTIPGSLHDKGQAHQDDLDFSLRLSADGTLSYQSAQKLQQYYHAQSMEGDALATIEKGDVIGMRLTPDRKVPTGADSAATAGAFVMQRPRYKVLKTVREVVSFPMKLMVVFGGAAHIGPVAWLRGKGADAATARKGPSDGSVASAAASEAAAGSAPLAERVVKARSAADLLTPGVMADEAGDAPVDVCGTSSDDGDASSEESGAVPSSSAAREEEEGERVLMGRAHTEIGERGEDNADIVSPSRVPR